MQLMDVPLLLKHQQGVLAPISNSCHDRCQEKVCFRPAIARSSTRRYLAAHVVHEERGQVAARNLSWRQRHVKPVGDTYSSVWFGASQLYEPYFGSPWQHRG